MKPQIVSVETYEKSMRDLVRDLVREELLNQPGAVIPMKGRVPGLPVVFNCCCPRDRCCASLSVLPTLIGDELGVTLIAGAQGGVQLDMEARRELAALLLDENWHGDHADLRV